MRHYTVEFRIAGFQKVERIYIGAHSKYEAYDKAVYEEIPKAYGEMPYSAWVSAVTYNNGNYQEFNTFEGNPY